MDLLSKMNAHNLELKKEVQALREILNRQGVAIIALVNEIQVERETKIREWKGREN